MFPLFLRTNENTIIQIAKQTLCHYKNKGEFFKLTHPLFPILKELILTRQTCAVWKFNVKKCWDANLIFLRRKMLFLILVSTPFLIVICGIVFCSGPIGYLRIKFNLLNSNTALVTISNHNLWDDYLYFLFILI